MHVAPMTDDASRLGIMRVFATRAAAELERRDTAIELQNAKEAGLHVCVGGIFGMGESFAQRTELAFDIKDLKT